MDCLKSSSARWKGYQKRKTTATLVVGKAVCAVSYLYNGFRVPYHVWIVKKIQLATSCGIRHKPLWRSIYRKGLGQYATCVIENHVFRCPNVAPSKRNSFWAPRSTMNSRRSGVPRFESWNLSATMKTPPSTEQNVLSVYCSRLLQFLFFNSDVI